MKMKRSFERANLLVKTDCGQNSGWFIEQDGIVVGELHEPIIEEMFWASYRIVPISGGDSLFRRELWENEDLKFRSISMGEYAPLAFAGGCESLSEGRILLRGAYLVPKSRTEAFFVYLAKLQMKVELLLSPRHKTNHHPHK